jgi:seryl-tRNA synthetase
MLDIRLFREAPDTVRADLQRRGAVQLLPWVDEVVAADATWRGLKAGVDRLRQRRNQLTAEIAELKKKGLDSQATRQEAAAVPARIAALEQQMTQVRATIDGRLMRLPNLLHPSVPFGKDENDNVPIRRWGERPRFSPPARDHIELMQELELLDMERAAKIAGARFYFLRGAAVRLEHALMQLALDSLGRRGFTLLEPPFMMRRQVYEGVTDFGDFGPVIYKVEGEDLHLIATSEHPLVAMHVDEILEARELPIRYAGISPCFRVEAGAHGKDTKGIFRTHQFTKVEQVVLCKPEDSWQFQEELIGNAEAIFQALGVHYRVVNICTGEIGTVAAKKYDLEAWLPGQENFREMVSCSNVTDYQARRLNIRYREHAGAETRLVHTLNSTAVTTRALVAVIENYQQADGSVRVPPVLVPYLGGLTELRRPA